MVLHDKSRFRKTYSFFRQNPNIEVSVGSVTIVSGNVGGDPDASYLVLGVTASLSSERVFTPGTGLTATDGGAGSAYTVAIDNSVVATVSGTFFTGPVSASLGLSVLDAGNSPHPIYFGLEATTGLLRFADVALIMAGINSGGTTRSLLNWGNFADDVLEVGDSSGGSTIVHNLSGSLQNLSDGSSYLVAGSNVTITSASSGQITIASTGGGGSVGDNLAVTDIDLTGSVGRILSSGSAAIKLDHTVGTVPNFAWLSDPSSWNSGQGVWWLGDATVEPTTIPSSGGMYVYSYGHVLKLRSAAYPALEIGEGAASSGIFRIPNNFAAYAASSAGASQPMRLFATNTSNTLFYGDPSYTKNVEISCKSAGYILLSPGASSTEGIKVTSTGASTEKLRAGNASLTAPDSTGASVQAETSISVRAGTATVPAFGDLRLAHSSSIVACDSTGVSKGLLEWGTLANDVLLIGQGGNLSVLNGAQTWIQANGSTRMQVQSTRIEASGSFEISGALRFDSSYSTSSEGTTTDATVTTLLTDQVPTDKTYIFEVSSVFTGIGTNNAKIARLLRTATLMYSASSLSVLGAATVGTDTTSGSPTWGANINAVGTTIAHYVTGAASENVKWRVASTVTYFGA